MARRYARRRYAPATYRPKREKYQFVPFSMTVNPPPSADDKIAGTYQLVVPAFTIAGVRKVKNFDVNFVTNSTDPLLYALVYIPEGAKPESFIPSINGTSAQDKFTELFAANQWVIACGSISQGAQNRLRTRMSRNLNNGDTVWLYVWRINTSSEEFVAVNATGSYVIKFN